MKAPGRRGFSLLEVLLATSILLGSIVVLGELVRLGLRNGRAARELTNAQLLCESKLNELTLGVAPIEPLELTPVEGSPGWLYSVQIEPLDDPQLISVRVRITEDVPEPRRPLEFELVRWLRAPGVDVPTSSLESAEPPPTRSLP